MTFLCHVKDVLIRVKTVLKMKWSVQMPRGTQVHGSCLLWVIGSCLQLSQE